MAQWDSRCLPTQGSAVRNPTSAGKGKNRRYKTIAEITKITPNIGLNNKNINKFAETKQKCRSHGPLPTGGGDRSEWECLSECTPQHEG